MRSQEDWRESTLEGVRVMEAAARIAWMMLTPLLRSETESRLIVVSGITRESWVERETSSSGWVTASAELTEEVEGS